MTDGDILAVRAPIDLDYLAPADTVLTIVSSVMLNASFTGNITTTIVDVSGNNTVRRVVVVISGRTIA